MLTWRMRGEKGVFVESAPYLELHTFRLWLKKECYVHPMFTDFLLPVIC